MRISDWSSDVCSSGLGGLRAGLARRAEVAEGHRLAGDDHRYEVAVAAGVAADLAVRRYRQAGLKAARHRLAGHPLGAPGAAKIGRAPCRERVCHYVENTVAAVSIKKKYKTNKQ